MKNIIFSTTRQWNPGDEIILAGLRNVFREIGEQYNPVIFNRHPDIRSCFQDLQFLRECQIPERFHLNPELRLLEANLKIGFFDNSIKPNTDCSFADWVVFAGTPEWCNGRTYDLYCHILRHNIPVMILGVGGGLDLYDPRFLKVIRKAKVLVAREAETLDAVREVAPGAAELACPALLSALREKERLVDRVRRIALIYHASVGDSVIWNGCSQTAHDWQMVFFRKLISCLEKDFQFSIICHYVDEIPLARRAFPGHELRYSYNAEDYLDIYREFDLVVGMRVHGIGAAASVGVPGVALAHCQRSLTCKGFLADVIPCELTSIDQAINQVKLNIDAASSKSHQILQHKASTMDAYKGLVGSALQDPRVDYGDSYSTSRQPSDLQRMADIAKLTLALHEGVEGRDRRGRNNVTAQAALNALHEIDYMRNSVSWRVTAPLRAFRRIIRAGKSTEKLADTDG